MTPFTKEQIEALKAELLVEALIEDGDLYTRALTAIRQLQQPWQGMDELEKGVVVIGKRMGGANMPAFVGERYDIRPNCLLNKWTGRWVECCAWMPLPHAPEPGQ